MSKFLIAMLLAGSALPAFAATSDDRSRSEARSERSERAERHSRSERSQRRAEPVERQQSRSPRVERAERERAAPVAIERQAMRRQMIERAERPAPRLRSRAPVSVRVETPAPEAVEPVRIRTAPHRRVERETIERRNLRRAPRIVEEARAGEDLVQPTRPLPRVLDRNRPGRVGRTPVFGTEPPEPATAFRRDARPERHWRTDWRRDRRFDWHDHRRRHRSLFRLGFYYDPFGWSYHRYGVGWRLWPSYYGRSFWLHDPWMYRLPPAYGPYRWVRYWDDALLVNIYTGQVVDVIHNFFW